MCLFCGHEEFEDPMIDSTENFSGLLATGASGDLGDRSSGLAESELDAGLTEFLLSVALRGDTLGWKADLWASKSSAPWLFGEQGCGGTQGIRANSPAG